MRLSLQPQFWSPLDPNQWMQEACQSPKPQFVRQIHARERSSRHDRTFCRRKNVQRKRIVQKIPASGFPAKRAGTEQFLDAPDMNCGGRLGGIAHKIQDFFEDLARILFVNPKLDEDAGAFHDQNTFAFRGGRSCNGEFLQR